MQDRMLTTAAVTPFDDEVILELEQEDTDRHAKIYLDSEMVLELIQLLALAGKLAS